MSLSGTIENAKIESTALTMADHGVLCFYLTLRMCGAGVNYGGYVLGQGYLGAKEFKGDEKGIEAIMRIMDVVGVSKWEDLSGKYCRIVSNGLGRTIDKIGNIIENKWFDAKEFWKDK